MNMNCNVVKDLIPLYIDECCSEESKKIVCEHIEKCDLCKKELEEMKSPSTIKMPDTPIKFSKINQWKASVMQSILLFVSFGLITIGVALEASTPVGLMNGFWAFNLVIPSTGFMLSLANWYFVKIYKSKKTFSCSSLLATLTITLCAFIWSMFHYDINLFKLFAESSSTKATEIIHALLYFDGIGILLTIVFAVISKKLSKEYAKMLGKN